MENYFNYFTEIEECFQRCRGTSALLSTLDWALIETWKESGLPLEAVLLGIERSFEKFFARPRKGRKVNSLAYCSQEVVRAAEEVERARVEGGTRPETNRASAAPFTPEEILGFLQGNAEALERASSLAQTTSQAVLAEDLVAAAADLRKITTEGREAWRRGEQPTANLEELERELSALEEKLAASLTRASSVERLAQFRREVERGLAPYRQKMTGAQLESLERQFLKKRLYEQYQVPRLSLFYL